MGTEGQRKKLYAGMSSKQAREKFLAVWSESFPDKDFEKEFVDVWPWMEVWHKLRTYNFTVDAMAQAFAEKLARMNARHHALELKVGLQKREIARLLDVVSERNGIVAGLMDVANGRTRTLEEIQRGLNIGSGTPTVEDLVSKITPENTHEEQ